MFQKRSPRFRPSIFDRLEERTVPSSGVAHAQVSAAAVGSTATSNASASASRLATLQNQLNSAGALVNAAYSTFATSLRQLELTLVDSSTAATPTSSVPLTSTVTPRITALVDTLATSVSAAYAGVPNIGNDAGVIGQGLNGPSAGSLNNQLLALFNAATVNGAVSQDSLPLLFSAVEGTLSYSYGSTAIQGLLAGLAGAGINPTTPSSTATAFNTATFGTQVNAAYSTFASTVRGVVAQIPTGSTTGTGTGGAAAATTAITTAVNTLGTSIGSALSGTTVAGFASYQSVEQALTLSSFGNLFAAAAPNGSVAAGNVALVTAVAENVISASYNSTAIQGYLLGQFTNANGTGVGSTGAGGIGSTGGSGTSTGGSGTSTGGTSTGGTGTGTSTGNSNNSGSLPTTVSGGNGTTVPGVGGQTGTTTGTGSGNNGTIGTGQGTGTGGNTTGTSSGGINGGTTGTTGTSGTGTQTGTTGINNGGASTGTGGTSTGTSVGTTGTTGNAGTGSSNTGSTATGTNTGGTSAGTATGGTAVGGSGAGTVTGGSGSGGIPSVGA